MRRWSVGWVSRTCEFRKSSNRDFSSKEWRLLLFMGGGTAVRFHVLTLELELVKVPAERLLSDSCFRDMTCGVNLALR